MEKRGAPNTEISLAGRALIPVREHADQHPRTVVLYTANGLLYTQAGEFAVLANRTDMRVTKHQHDAIPCYPGRFPGRNWETTKERNYRNVPLRAFILKMNRTYNPGVKSVNCIPEQMTITASIHFKDPVEKIYG